MSFFYPSNFSALCIGVAKMQFPERYSPAVIQQKFCQGFRGTTPMPSRDWSKHHPHFTQEAIEDFSNPGTNPGKGSLQSRPLSPDFLLSPFTKLLTGDKFSFLNCSYQDLQ